MDRLRIPYNSDKDITDEEYEALVEEGDRLFEQATQAWRLYFEEHPEDRDLEQSDVLSELSESLSKLDDASLWQMAQRHLTTEQEETVEELLFKLQREGLTSDERAQLDQIRLEHDMIFMTRATAIGLLHERGTDIRALIRDPNAES